MGKGRKKKHAAPRYVSNADELANRETAFNDQDKDRKARRKAAGCDDDDLDGGSGGASSMLDMATRRGNNESSDEEEVVKKVKKLTLAETIGLETASLNGKKKKNTMSKQDVANGNFEKATLSRREREVLEKDAAQQHFNGDGFAYHSWRKRPWREPCDGTNAKRISPVTNDGANGETIQNCAQAISNWQNTNCKC